MKRNFKRFVFSLGALLFLASCQSDDDKSSVSKCDFDVTIDGDLFVVPTPDPFTIVNAEIINDCLEITIGASGCDGNSWDVNLISNYPITNEFTVGTDLSLKFVNIEDCEAFLMSTYSFNLTEIYEDYSNPTFSLEGWDGELQLTN